MKMGFGKPNAMPNFIYNAVNFFFIITLDETNFVMTEKSLIQLYFEVK